MKTFNPTYIKTYLSKPLMNYNKWYKIYLDNFRKEHPNSTAPRNHILSDIFDEYVNDWKEYNAKTETKLKKSELMKLINEVIQEEKINCSQKKRLYTNNIIDILKNMNKIVDKYV